MRNIILISIFLLLSNIVKGQDANVFTIHNNGEPAVCYYSIDNSEIAVKIYPNKHENNAGVMLHVLNSCSDKLVVDSFNPAVFIEKGKVAVNTRNYGGASFNLYGAPSKDSPILCTISSEQTVPVFDIDSQWMYVKAINNNKEEVYGWLEPSMQCANPFTTCP